MKLFEKGELKLLWPFYLDSLLSPMLYFSPAFIIVYFISLEFSLFQIGILMAFPSLITLLFEIPTGAFADLYGRKFSVLLGYAIVGLSFLMLFFVRDFYMFLLVFGVIGLGTTFSSGAHEAWITDLIKKKKKNLLHNYFVKINSVDSFGLIFSGFIGALFVGLFGTKIIFPFTALSFLLSFIILLMGKEYFKKKKTNVKYSYRNLKKQTDISLKYSYKHPVLFWFFIASFIIVFGMVFNEGLTWTPFLQSLGFPDYAFGYLWSAIAGVMVIAPWISKKFMKKDKEKMFIVTVLSISVIITLMVVFVESLVSALFVTIFSLFFFASRIPAERMFFHKFIPSKMRATIGSFESIIASLAIVMSGPVIGLLVDLIGARWTIFVGGLVMIPGILSYLMIKEKK